MFFLFVCFLCSDLLSNIQEPFDFFLNLLQELGFTISEKKLTRPDTKVVCLGIMFDTAACTISIPPTKLQDTTV